MPRRLSATYASRLLALALVALAMAWAWLFVDVHRAWAAESDTTISTKVRVYQEYRVDTSGLQNTFEYFIVPEEADAPLPVDANGNAFQSFKFTRDQDMWLTIPVPVYTSPSAEHVTYHYTLMPAKTTLPNGLYYVDAQDPNLKAGINIYYLDIDVVMSSVDAAHSLVVPTIHMEGFDGPKITDPGWRIAYKKPTTTPSTKPASSKGGKSTSGAKLSKTGDPLDPSLIAAFATSGAALLLLGLFTSRRRKWGEADA